MPLDVVPSVSAVSRFAVLPFCRLGITLVLLRFPRSVSAFWPTHRFGNSTFRFVGRARVCAVRSGHLAKSAKDGNAEIVRGCNIIIIVVIIIIIIISIIIMIIIMLSLLWLLSLSILFIVHYHYY